MKKRVIKIGILVLVFVLATIISSILLNRGNADTTADLNAPTLPTVAFMIDGQEMNVLEGHKNQMHPSSVRDTITPFNLSEGITGYIKHEDVTQCTYSITTLDGKTELKKGNVKIKDQTIQIPVQNALQENQEALLTIQLQYRSIPVYYYTRIVSDSDLHLTECKDFVEELHTSMMEKKNEALLTRVMEPSSEGDHYSLHHVTIHSDVQHAMWGSLKPSVVGDIKWKIKEARSAYTSIQLKYQVVCEGDNNSEEIYTVEEFFKVTYSESKMYLLEYDRVTEEKFDPSNVVLSRKGIILGLTSEDTPYMVSEDGKYISFIQNRELWSYSVEDNTFSLIFSFAESEKKDERNEFAQHQIQIMSMEKNGNMTFSVYGYMNRGLHEGQTGLSIYYYDKQEDMTEEKAFIPSTDSMAVIEKEWNKLAYYNSEQDVLYVMVEGNLQKLDLEEDTSTTLLDNLSQDQYVASESGNLFAYQKDGVFVWDFETDNTYEVKVNKGEIAVPLGFIGSDFVYGVTTQEDKGMDSSGKEIQAMRRLEICNSKNEIIKVYEVPDSYILNVTFDGNMITLTQGVKNGNVYQKVTEDYITSNQESASEGITLKAYWTDLKQKQYRLEFASGIKDKNAKERSPKFALKESVPTLDIRSTQQEYYTVYGKGERVGIYEEVSQAIAKAEEASGVVLTPGQNYAWEAGNQVAWYRNFKVSGFVPKSGESSLAACARQVLAYEGISADVSSELAESPVEDVMEKHLQKETIRFTGCSCSNMRYLIDKGVPVIAMTGANEAVLLIGYDAQTVTYVNTASGGIGTVSFVSMDNMTKASGNTYIGYIR